MEFEKRLERAIVRGQQTRDAKGRAEAERALNEEDLKALHSRCQIDLSEHIEKCLKEVSDHFPGFDFQTIVGGEGWGATISRDDFERRAGRTSENLFSRLEMLIRPLGSAHIIELAAKGTVRNKELFNRNHYQFLSQADVDSFNELIDLWSLEYAEQYAART